MTLCVTVDALIKAASDSHDNYERLNNGDGVSDSRQAARGTKEGTEMAGELSTSWSGLRLMRANILNLCQQETHGPSPGLSPDALCS